MPIPVIIPIVMGAISIAKGASDKKKARDKYYYNAQSELYQQRQTALTQTEAERSEALKSIAKQYAVNAINENLSLQKQAQEIADKKIKRDQIIAVTTGTVAITLLIAHLIKQN
jgi:3-hydroxyacyl-CoA dehydrogenase